MTILVGVSMSAATVPASDSKISYIGRTLTEGTTVSFDWSGTTVKVRFSGTSLRMNCLQDGSDWFNVWVDKTPVAKEDAKFQTKPGEQCITICSGLKKGIHEVTIQKRTEGEQGCITVTGFETDGSFLEPNEPNLRNIEFIGDSYTCGFGTEASSRTEPFRPEEENLSQKGIISPLKSFRYLSLQASSVIVFQLPIWKLVMKINKINITTSQSVRNDGHLDDLSYLQQVTADSEACHYNAYHAHELDEDIERRA